MRRLVGDAPVKRHERGGNAGDAHDVRAPAIAGDGRHLDQVRAAPDRFFKAMYDSGHSFLNEDVVGKCGFYALRACKQAKRVTKTRAQAAFE